MSEGPGPHLCTKDSEVGEVQGYKALISPLSYSKSHLIYMQFLSGMHPRGPGRLRVAPDNREKESVLRSDTPLGCQEKGSSRKVQC